MPGLAKNVPNFDAKLRSGGYLNVGNLRFACFPRPADVLLEKILSRGEQ